MEQFTEKEITDLQNQTKVEGASKSQFKRVQAQTEGKKTPVLKMAVFDQLSREEKVQHIYGLLKKLNLPPSGQRRVELAIASLVEKYGD